MLGELYGRVWSEYFAHSSAIEMEGAMKVMMLAWDWKESPDLKVLIRALNALYNGKNVPCMIDVDTKSDMNVLVVSAEIIDEKQAQAIYVQQTNQKPEDSWPYDKIVDIKWPL